jgi:hypothetical protein
MSVQAAVHRYRARWALSWGGRWGLCLCLSIHIYTPDRVTDTGPRGCRHILHVYVHKHTHTHTHTHTDHWLLRICAPDRITDTGPRGCCHISPRTFHAHRGRVHLGRKKNEICQIFFIDIVFIYIVSPRAFQAHRCGLQLGRNIEKAVPYYTFYKWDVWEFFLFIYKYILIPSLQGAPGEKFWKVSALVHCLCKLTILRLFRIYMYIYINKKKSQCPRTLPMQAHYIETLQNFLYMKYIVYK